jgi:hypothetical protein
MIPVGELIRQLGDEAGDKRLAIISPKGCSNAFAIVLASSQQWLATCVCCNRA